MTPDEPGEAFPEQPFLTHLIELRSRLMRCLWAVGILLVPLTFFANRLFSILAAPMLAKLPIGNTLIATQVVTPMVANAAGVIPGGVTPARRYALPFRVAVKPCAAAGRSTGRPAYRPDTNP